MAERHAESSLTHEDDWGIGEETVGDLSRKVDELEMKIDSLESKIDELKFHIEEETEKWFRTISFQIGDSMKTVLLACSALAAMSAYLIWKLVHA